MCECTALKKCDKCKNVGGLKKKAQGKLGAGSGTSTDSPLNATQVEKLGEGSGTSTDK